MLRIVSFHRYKITLLEEQDIICLVMVSHVKDSMCQNIETCTHNV